MELFLSHKLYGSKKIFAGKIDKHQSGLTANSTLVLHVKIKEFALQAVNCSIIIKKGKIYKIPCLHLVPLF